MLLDEITSNEPRKTIMLIDSKSFYASVKSVELGLNPLKSVLFVMSQQENTNGGLVLAASPMDKKLLGLVTGQDVVMYQKILGLLLSNQE